MGNWPRGMHNNMGQLPDPNNPKELGSPDPDDVMAQWILGSCPEGESVTDINYLLLYNFE
jgi:hypothetical protein